jgi:hypothetical protein
VWFAYTLAEHLHMTVQQVMGMTEVEMLGWSEYFRLRAEKAKK